MSEISFLPVGHHLLDPSTGFDPVRTHLHSLWCNLFWVLERSASVEAYWPNNLEDAERELGYLAGDTDDALQHLARLIELLLMGQTPDTRLRISRGNSPPYFGDGMSMAASAILPPGQHQLDPASAIDPIRFFIQTGKASLIEVDESRSAFESLRDTDPVGAEHAAERMLGRTLRAAENARRHLARLVELVLAGHGIVPEKQGPPGDALRLFKRLTEADWHACADVWTMCRMLRPLDYGVTIRLSERKWRLFAIACVRRIENVFKDERTRDLVKACEQLAEGLLSREELGHLWKEAFNPPNPDKVSPHTCPPEDVSSACAFQALASNNDLGTVDASRASHSAAWARRAVVDPVSENRSQIALLRDIFGNPFRPATLDPAWLACGDGAVRRIAQAIYDGRAFERMPILADALEDAGCTDLNILAHCRETREHVRGCWVLDLVLGRV